MNQKNQPDSTNGNHTNFSSIPEELKSLNQWVVWRYKVRKGKKTKVLYRADQPHRTARSNDSLTWGSFDQAINAFQKGQVDGIGFVVAKSDPYVGIDLDHFAAEPGQVELWAQEIVDQMNSYTERSPSGNGLHIFVKGSLPKSGRKKGDIEMYEDKRFFTMTGNHVEETPSAVKERQTELTLLHEKVFGLKGKSEKKENRSEGFKGVGLTDDEILAKAKTAKNGEMFIKLYAGNWEGNYNSQSEADLALCSLITFWAGHNPEQIDRLFRQSKLYRPKWDERRGEKTYGEKTIEKALEELTEFYGQKNTQHPQTHDHSKGNSSDPPNIAESFLTHCGLRSEDGLRLRWHRQEWLEFNGKVFVPLPNQDLEAKVMAFIQTSSSRSKATQTLLKNVLTNLKGICYMPSAVQLPALWNGKGWVSGSDYLVVSNGIINLHALIQGQVNASLTLHTANFVSTVGLPFPFDPQAQCPQWKKFLEEVLPDPECRQLLRELFGYCLTYNTSLQKFFLFEGSGGNGKGVVLRILTALLGEANISSLPLELFSSPHGLESTLGKLVNITSEIGDIDRVAEGLLKQFTGDDHMHFNPKYRNAFSAKPTAKLIIASNIRPPFKDRSAGLWRRLILLPFPVTIPENQQDENLTGKLIEELPGILNWAICGAFSLKKRGRFAEPELCRVSRDEFKTEANPTRFFLEEECIRDPTGEERVGWVYARYTSFCKDRGYKPLNEANFGREVRNVFPDIKRVKIPTGPQGVRGWGYRGLRLRHCEVPTEGYNS